MTKIAPDIRAVLERHRAELLAVDGVVGVGVGEEDGEQVLKVLVNERLPEHAEKIPPVLEDFRVVIVETGSFHAQPRKEGD